MILRLKYKLNLGVTDCRPLNLRNLYFFVKKSNEIQKSNSIKKKNKKLYTLRNFVFGSKEYYVKKEFCFDRRGRRSTLDFKIVATYVRCHSIPQL